MPILFFTQLMGLAFGLQAQELGIGMELVDSSQALSRIGVEVPVKEPPAPRKPRRKSQGLPMPRMAEAEEGEE
jgi:heterodisulfide reductase subunit B